MHTGRAEVLHTFFAPLFTKKVLQASALRGRVGEGGAQQWVRIDSGISGELSPQASMGPGRLHPVMLICKGHLWKEQYRPTRRGRRQILHLSSDRRVGTFWNSTRTKALSCTWEGIHNTGWASLGGRPAESLGVYGAEREPAVCTGSTGQQFPRLCEQDYSQQREGTIALLSTHQTTSRIPQPPPTNTRNTSVNRGKFQQRVSRLFGVWSTRPVGRDWRSMACFAWKTDGFEGTYQQSPSTREEGHWRD